MSGKDENLNGRDCLGFLRINGKAMLKWI